MPGFRQLKKTILGYLSDKNADRGLAAICRLPGKKAVNPLFSFFYNRDERVRWRSVTAMGMVLADMALNTPATARIVMRRMIWNLNDESGGIGWGSPEAMGETMARSRLMADEYHHMLLSYIMPDGNFIEHEALQRGVLWGIARLAQIRPALVESSAHLLCPYLNADDPMLQGLAAWTAGLYDCAKTNDAVAGLKNSPVILSVYTGQSMETATIGELASSKRFIA